MNSDILEEKEENAYYNENIAYFTISPLKGRRVGDEVAAYVQLSGKLTQQESKVQQCYFSPT